MDRLQAVFKALRRRGRTALIPFIVGGDPTLASTPALLLALEDAGADIIEVGIPFSDPLADGPVIQAAAARALAHGATPHRVLEAIARVHHRLQAPVVCLSYWNLVVQFSATDHAPLRPFDSGRGPSLKVPPHGASPGPFVQAAARRGVAGLIIPDLPVEEGSVLRAAAMSAGVAPVFLAAPTSPPDRLRAIARQSEGFIYYVSVAGTTGMRRVLPPTLINGVRQLKLLTTKPVCVGFGISTPAQARLVARVADGVIVGSALVHTLAQARNQSARLRQARQFVSRLRHTVR